MIGDIHLFYIHPLPLYSFNRMEHPAYVETPPTADLVCPRAGSANSPIRSLFLDTTWFYGCWSASFVSFTL